MLSCVCVPDALGAGSTAVDHVPLFRADPRHRWSYRVHEQILPALWVTGADLRWSGLAVEHVGYVDPAVRDRGIGTELVAALVDAARAVAKAAQAGRLDPDHLTEKSFRRFLDEPEIPDVDLFVRSSGEQRTSNFLLWQSAYAELVFLDRLWPDFDRRDLWRAIELYADRDRRYGGAVPNQVV